MVGLQHYKDFEDILKKYHVSDRAKQVLDGLKLVLLLAPTSGGRNTIIRHQLKTGRYYYVVSDTTRQPRINDGVLEQDGKEYWFKTEEQILADLNAGEFLEAEIIHGQQVSGISIRELEKAKAENKTAITDIELVGMHNILRTKPDTIAILLLPPSFDEWQQRLSGRGHMGVDELKRRLETAQRIFEDGLKQDYYHYIISEDIEQSGAIIDAVVEGKTNPHQDRGRSLIAQLQSSLSDKIISLN
jgi:guanylate kinase